MAFGDRIRAAASEGVGLLSARPADVTDPFEQDRQRDERRKLEDEEKKKAQEEFKTMRERLSSLPPAVIVGRANMLAEKASKGDEVSRKQYLAISDMVDQYKDLAKRAEEGDIEAQKEFTEVKKVDSTGTLEDALLAANRTVSGVAKGVVEAPVKLVKQQIAAKRENLAKSLFEAGKIDQEQYSQVLNASLEDIKKTTGIDLRKDSPAEIARKQTALATQVGIDIVPVGAAGKALKGGAAIGKGIKAGAAFGGVYGGTEALRQEDPTLASVAGGTATGAAGGAVLGGALAGVMSRIGRGGKEVAEEVTERTGRQVNRTPKIEGAGQTTAGIQAAEELKKIDLALQQHNAGITPLSAADARDLMRYRNRLTQEVETGMSSTATPASSGVVAETTPTSAPVAGAVAQDFPLTPKTNGQPSSRVKQFEDSLKETVETIEKDPGYLTELKSRGGGRVVSNVETHRKALAQGPMPEDQLFSAKQGDAVDAVDVVRAKATTDAYARDYTEALKSGDVNLITQAADNLKKAEAGYNILSGEPGRATQIQSTFIDKQAQLAQKYRQFMDSNGGKPPTAKQMEVWKAEVQENLNQATREAKRFKLPEDHPTMRVIRGVEEWATAAKLTSPTTHLRNIIGNSMTFIQRSIEQPISATVRAVRGKTGIGEVSKTFGSHAGWSQATHKLAQGLKDAILLRGGTLDDLAIREGYKQAIPGKFGQAVRIPFKFLSAVDDFGKTILRDSSLNQQAYELAWKEGLRGKNLSSRIAQLVELPTDDMLKIAQKNALEYTFQSDLGKMGQWIQKGQNLPGGKLILPFVKTPTNIIKFQAQRSPLGFISPRIWRDITKGTAREQSEAISKVVTGSLFSLGAYQFVDHLSEEGRITGALPDAGTERDIFYAQGKRPYSIKIGDKWWGFQNVQPLGLYLLYSKALHDSLKEGDEKTASEIAGRIVSVAAKGLTELPFVQGVSNLVEALAQPEEKGKYALTNFARGFVPNISRDIALYHDDIVRAPEGIKQQIMAMIPGLSKKIPARTDFLGREAKGDRNDILRSFVRLGSTAQTNKLVDALDKIGQETGYYPSPPDPNREQRGKKLSDAEYLRLKRRYGELLSSQLERALNNSDFRNASPEQKEADVKKISESAADQARDDILGEGQKKTSVKGRNY